MANIDVSELPEANWPLVAALGIVAAVVIYVVYQVLQGSGATQVTKSASNAASAVIDASTGVIDQLTGQVPDSQQGTSFWTGLNNLFSTGSIYGN